MIKAAVTFVLMLLIGCERTSSLGLAQIDAAAGGASKTGGVASSGGATGSGGAAGKAGASGSGGASGTAGVIGGGGAVARGGASSTGGYYIGSTGPVGLPPWIDGGSEPPTDADATETQP